MSVFISITTVALLFSELLAINLSSKACSTCSDLCSLIPPAGVEFPCYQGTKDDAAFCFNSDPILKDGTTWECGTCTSLGYASYLHNDPIYKTMELWTKSSSSITATKPPCSTCSGLCSLLPPNGVNFPCYEGTKEDAAACFATDPILKEGTTWTCGNCTRAGYPNYLRNDPIYKSMGLWTQK
jgi:hypothetical protein